MAKAAKRKTFSPKVAAIIEDDEIAAIEREEQIDDPIEQLRHAIRCIVDKLEQLHPTQLGRPIWTSDEKRKMGIE